MSVLFSPFEVTRLVLPFELVHRGLTGEGVEVGVAGGFFSRHILKHWPGKLNLVDPWENLSGYAETYPQEENYQQMKANTEEFNGRCTVIRSTSVEGSKFFEDGSLDFVYLDANHEYDYVKADLEAWWPKIKRGGLFAGDDYGCFPDTPIDFGHGALSFSVKRAVDEWAVKEQRNISINWYADWDCKGHIQRPDGSKDEFLVRARNWYLIK
jgi:hypothetical protein